jgi:aminoglycoside phosphotransferase (APT) family kinase protein
MTERGTAAAMEGSRDGLDVTALRRYLASALPGRPSAPVSAGLISGGRSNLTYLVTDGTHRWVLRRPPLGQVFHGAHDVSREYRVMSSLRGTPVPVPRTRLNCADSTVIGAPFYLMDEVEGTVLRTPEAVSALSEPARRRLGYALVDTLAALHEVRPFDVGLDDLGQPDGYLRRQLDRWARQYQQIKVRDLPHIDPIIAWLADSMPETYGASIVHGDFRLDNVVVDSAGAGEIRAVLDWEMATLGDPLADLGVFISFWDEPGKPFNPVTAGLTAFPGFPSAEEIIERYARQRGVTVGRIDWYRVFAQFKLAVILEQIHVRHVRGQTRGEGFGEVGPMVTALLDMAYSAIGDRAGG